MSQLSTISPASATAPLVRLVALDGTPIEPADDDGLAAFDARHPVRTPQVAPISGGSPDAETSASAISLSRLDAVARAIHGDAPTSAE